MDTVPLTLSGIKSHGMLVVQVSHRSIQVLDLSPTCAHSHNRKCQDC